MSKLVKTNIGRMFIKVISKHFPPIQKFVKVISKNTLKFSYSCMSNIRSKVNGHNKKILQAKPIERQKLCNRLVKEDCPLNGLCLMSGILYQATTKRSDSKYQHRRDTKKSMKRPSRIVMQITKNNST